MKGYTMTNKTALLLSLLILLPSFSGCAGSGNAPAETAAAQVQTETESSVIQEDAPFYEKVLPMGRTYTDESGTVWMALSGSGMAFDVTGKSLKIKLAGDSGALVGQDGTKARVAVYLDGERVIDEMVDRREKELTVFEGDTERTAEVRVVKLSESTNSVCGVSAVETDGSIKPAAEKALKMEFIGDSITCGYGVDDPEHKLTFKTDTEDCTKTYAYKTAEALDADVNLVSYSGYGICSGYTTNGKQNTNQLVPTYYDKFGFSYTSFGFEKKADTIEWDHSKFEPDVIVINLGTNDASWAGSNEENQAVYISMYDEFVRHVREVHPDSYIICSLGIMGNQLYPCIESMVEAYRKDTGDERISAFMFDVQDVNADGYATDWHPTEATHEKAAKKLTDYIRELGLAK